MELQTGDTIFQTWRVKNVIGKGSFGTVYEIERNEFGHVYRAAAKVIPISKEQFYADDILEEELSEENYAEYYRSLVEDVVEECALMERMKGDSHIVSYEDHQVEQKKMEVGLFIFVWNC